MFGSIDIKLNICCSIFTINLKKSQFILSAAIKLLMIINAHGMVYTAPMNENCFSRKGAKNIFFVYFWFKSIFTVKS